MSMSRQDYEVVAYALRDQWHRAAEVSNQRERMIRMDQIEMVARRLATDFLAVNSRFDHERFMAAAICSAESRSWAADIISEVFP